MCKSIRRLLNMNPEWDFYMFGDDDIVAYLQHSRYKSLQPLFDIVATGAIRADLWRYLVMFDYGGVYFDIDAWAWAPLRDFIPNDAAVVTTSMTAGLLCQWALMYRPGHFIMSAAAKEAFQSVLRVVTGEEDWKRHEFEWKETVTGPPALSRAFERTSKLIRGRPEDRVIMYLTNNFGGKMQNRFDEIKKEQQAKQDGTAGNALWTDSSVSLFHVNANRERFIAEKNMWMERINRLLPDVESGPVVYRKGPESFITN
ncbi:Initiation-specific alpha-1,6-mannosyltransferase [Hondaea fermentalgiana]|uniref:Initiation-specific alpha-1,6-mannosyltransferase n=1 Tax=Hondaea fermentalgiana TaxID=2315210 RepID=A0A2R5GH66_9STRA|nr:Initiation-specific alpha-1,6-mannosyltransferase [Hondaea fermentalgiana]|eukprot:GBG29935.1 Initiation-specific alpha-1,6-mannosyltransferase [Hondaea fermentalgiana]